MSVLKTILSGNISGASGSSAELDINDHIRDEYTVAVEGTWGGGTMSVQVEATSGVWVPIRDSSNNLINLAANGARTFQMLAGKTRITLSGAAGANLNYYLFH